MLRALIRAALLAAMGLLGAAAAAADTVAGEREFQVFVENDMLARSDRYYTNGIKVGLGVPLETLQAPARWLLEHTADADGDIHLGLFVGQNLYTPKSITIAAPQPGDRPWAAWLYLGGVAQRVRGNRLDTVEIDVGMVGPAALGRQVQSGWHRLIGSPQPRGWDHQIPNEPAFLVSYEQKRRQAWGACETIPHGGATLGTVMSLVRVGGILRCGRNMSGFGADTVEPGGAMLQGTRGDDAANHAADFEWFWFAGFDLRFVARNIFLDGAAFRDGPSVERRSHVHDLVAGVSLRVRKLRLSLTRVRRSEEFVAAGGGRQTFDSVNLGWEF